MEIEIVCCVRCGQAIKEVCIIGGKPYGTTCAEIVLGFALPTWFKGGDYDKEKFNYENEQKKQQDEQEKRYQFAIKNWDLITGLSKAEALSRNNNDFENNFIMSICKQLYINPSPSIAKFDSYEEAKNDNYLRTYIHGYWSSRSKTLNDLSEKQKSLAEKIIRKYAGAV